MAEERDIYRPLQEVVVVCLRPGCGHERPAYKPSTLVGEWVENKADCSLCREKAWLSRSVRLPNDKERKKVIAEAHIVDCECGVVFLLRQESCSECPGCENEHHFDEDRGKVVRT